MARPHFRAGVVAVVRRGDDTVLAFERADLVGQWQLPQGGIDPHERPVDAAWRELGEEAALGPSDVELSHEYPYWTVYEFPEGLRRRHHRLGQAHRWFEFRVRRDDVEPVPDGREFVRWRWMTVDELLDAVVEFRRRPYEQVLRG